MTALNQLLKYIENISEDRKSQVVYDIGAKVLELLDVEKQQIIDAWWETGDNNYLYSNIAAEEYFNTLNK